MELKSRVTARQSQRLALTPMMRQSLALLRLPTQALCDEIAREAAENPLLIVEPAAGQPAAYDVALATQAAPESLAQGLSQQIAAQHLKPQVEAAAHYLMGELREDGYLDLSLSALADEYGLSLGLLQAGLAALQKCEPVGIGARTLTEFVELRLIDAGISTRLANAVASRLNDFAEARWRKLSKALGTSQAELVRISKLLRALPSAPIDSSSTIVDIYNPEISVEHDGNGGLSVALLRATLPGISVLKTKRADLTTPELRAYFDRACRMKSGISARSETLLRIGRYIASTQAKFFLGDHSTVFPVTRAEAATALVMHASTLGRALSGKALLAESRIYPLSMFFSRALPGAEGGISPFDVQRQIHSIVAAESAAAPRSDESISAQLKHEGVDIARRTVAKYRKCMRIPSSYARRRRKV